MKPRLFRQLPGLALTALLALLVGQGVAFGHEDGNKSVSQRPALRKHPQVGAWLILNAPSGPSTVIFSADGTVVFGTQATQAGPQGGVFVSAELGTWEPVDNQKVHFTAVMLLSDATGMSQGSITVDAYQTVSTDEQSFTSDPESKVIIRDVMYNIVAVIGPNAPGAPVTGVRMSVGSPGFPD